MIYISAGHHEKAQGAKYSEGGDMFTEYQFTTEWADLIVELLSESCIRVPNGSLKSKIEFINKTANKGDLAVEIHFNSAKMWKDQNSNGVIDDDEMVHVGRGSETLYYPGSKTGKAAAESIQFAIEQILPPNRGAKEGWYQMNPAKGPDFFLAKSRCTAIIIEPEFIDNIDKIIKNKNAACHVIASTLLEIQSGYR